MLISNFCNKNLQGDMVGIEIELEDAAQAAIPYSYWETHSEGSLRNGVELVSSPLHPNDVVLALKEVKERVASNSCGDRTSVHLHFNMSHLSSLAVLKFGGLFLALERALENTFPLRTSNNYCIPTYKQDKPLNYGYNFSNVGVIISRERNKYSAFNIQPLTRFGTVEFRSHGGVIDVEDVLSWVLMLSDIKEASSMLVLHKVLREGRTHVDEVLRLFPRVADMVAANREEYNLGVIQLISEVDRCAA